MTITMINTVMDGITTTTGDTTMTEITSLNGMMNEAIAKAFVAARRRQAPEHHSRLVKAREPVAECAVTFHSNGSATVKGAHQPEYTVDPVGCSESCTGAVGLVLTCPSSLVSDLDAHDETTAHRAGPDWGFSHNFRGKACEKRL
jgi:hypothetical protein